MSAEEMDTNQAIIQAEEGRAVKQTKHCAKLFSSQKKLFSAILQISGILIVLLLIGLTILRTTRFAYSRLPCALQTDEIDSTNNETQGRHYNLRFHRFSNLVYLLTSLLRWVEYIYLFYGAHSFLRTTMKWPREFRSAIVASTKRFMIRKKSRPTFVGAVFYFIMFTVISFLLPTIGMLHDMGKFPDHITDYRCHALPEIVSILYHSFTIVANIVAVIVRITIISAAAMSGGIWLELTEDELTTCTENKYQQSADETGTKSEVLSVALQPNSSKDWDAAVNRYHNSMIDYETRVDKVRPIYKIFRSWFVIQWVRYLVGFIMDVSSLLRPWFYDDYDDTLLLGRIGLDCFYDIIVLTSSYLAALKMNAYLRRYIRKLQQNQVDSARNVNSGSQLQYTLAQSIFRIEMIPKSQFQPRIPGFGVNLSLRGPGFIIGTGITVIGLVAALTSF